RAPAYTVSRPETMAFPAWCARRTTSRDDRRRRGSWSHLRAAALSRDRSQADAARGPLWPPEPAPASSSPEHQRRAAGDEGKARQVVPADGLLEVDHGEAGKHEQRDHLLDGLELGGGIRAVADAVGGDGETVLDQGDAPAHGDDRRQGDRLELQVAVPGQ